MNLRERAKWVSDRLCRADGVVFTKEQIIEEAMREAYQAGLNAAALYTADEIGHDHLADEIRRLPCCF